MYRRTLLATAALALVGQAGWADNHGAPILMLHTAAAPSVVAYVAEDQGLFDKYGVDVTLETATGGVLVQALVSDSAQVVLSTPTVVMQALDNGLPLKVIATTNTLPDATPAGVVVAKDSAITDAAGLNGKRIGVPGIGGLLDVTMRKWMDENGGDSKSAQIVEIQLPMTGDVLRGGQVDAVASVDPFVTRAVESDAGTYLGNYLDVVTPGSAAGVVTVTAAFADANPEAVSAMQQAMEEAAKIVIENPQAARDAIARFAELPPPVVANIALPNVENIRLDATTSFGFWNELALEQGLVREAIDMNNAIIPFPN